MIKDGNFIHIESFMVSELGLKGNDLLIYAIIYGFSQDGVSHFTGSLEYLASWTNSTVQGCLKNLNSLVERGLISKQKKGNFCEYWVNFEIETKQSLIENEQQRLNKVESGLNKVESGLNKVESEIKQSLNNTIINNNLNNRHTIGACALSSPKNENQQDKNQQNEFNWGDLQKDLWFFINLNNTEGRHRRILIKSDSELSFIQSDCRELVEKLKTEAPFNIRQAFFNFLEVVSMDDKTWWNSCAFSSFIKNYYRFTAENYNQEDYLETKRRTEK